MLSLALLDLQKVFSYSQFYLNLNEHFNVLYHRGMREAGSFLLPIGEFFEEPANPSDQKSSVQGPVIMVMKRSGGAIDFGISKKFRLENVWISLMTCG